MSKLHTSIRRLLHSSPSIPRTASSSSSSKVAQPISNRTPSSCRSRSQSEIQYQYRSFTSTPYLQSSGLTNIFDTPDLPSLSVTKLNDKGFILSDNLVVPGGVVFLGGRAMMWDVDPPNLEKAVGPKGLEGAWEGWDVERFKVFEVVVPRPGQNVVPAPKRIRDYISSLGIQLDVMDSRNAASTYNLLSEEGRTIGAALCPLKPINPRTGGSR